MLLGDTFQILQSILIDLSIILYRQPKLVIQEPDPVSEFKFSISSQIFLELSTGKQSLWSIVCHPENPGRSSMVTTKPRRRKLISEVFSVIMDVDVKNGWRK